MTKKKRILLITGGVFVVAVIIGAVVLLNSKMFSEWVLLQRMRGEYTAVGVSHLQRELDSGLNNIHEMAVTIEGDKLICEYDNSILGQERISHTNVVTIMTNPQKPIYVDREYLLNNGNWITKMVRASPFLYNVDTIDDVNCIVVELFDETAFIQLDNAFYLRQGPSISKLTKI